MSVAVNEDYYGYIYSGILPAVAGQPAKYQFCSDRQTVEDGNYFVN